MEKIIAPAYLWIGSREELVAQAESFLCKQWCKHGGCKMCTICRQVAARQYYALRWLTPEKSIYTTDQIDEILRTLTLALENNEHYFFVFESAELLSISSANRLLKSLEEPTVGYHFLLLSESVDRLLPTIVSRCVIRQLHGESTTTRWEALLAFLKNPQESHLAEFDRELERVQPTEHETSKILDSLIKSKLEIHYSASKSKSFFQEEQALSIIKKALEYQPMPGSAKLFWRNLFLQLLYSASNAI